MLGRIKIGCSGVRVHIVRHIDKELRPGRVRIACASHGDRAAQVLQAVAGFIGDRLIGLSLLESRQKAAALGHEARDKAVENGAIIEQARARTSAIRLFFIEFGVSVVMVSRQYTGAGE